jgi:GTP pyrophosphokinase
MDRSRLALCGLFLLQFGMAAAKHLKGPEFENFMRDFGLHSLDETFIRVGYGRLEPRHLVDRLAPAPAKDVPKTEESSFMEKVVRAAAQKTRKSNSLVSVDGMDDVLVHFAKCCHPIPGDPISGFISRGRGVMVHRADCPKAFELDQLRKVDVAWTGSQATEGQERVVRVRVISNDVPGLLKSMSEVFSVQGINIESAQIRTTKDKKAICNFEVRVKDATQLNNAIYELQKIKGILGVTRVLH